VTWDLLVTGEIIRKIMTKTDLPYNTAGDLGPAGDWGNYSKSYGENRSSIQYSWGKSESSRNLTHRQKRSRNARALGRTANVNTHDRSSQFVNRLVKLWVAARKYIWPFLDYPCRHGLELENRRFFVLSWFFLSGRYVKTWEILI
jgi:hypothetical protein